MDLDDLREALDAAGRRAAIDVADARASVGVRAQRRRRRQRGVVSAVMLAGAIAVIVVVLAIAGGGSNAHSPVVVTQPLTTYEPLPSRATPAMVYDGAHGDVVLFGGQDLDGVLGDTWTWDGHGWVARHPAVSPPARTGGVMAYDPRSRTVLLFGGVAPPHLRETQAYDDLWSWDGTTWTQLHPQHLPPWSSGLAMSYDPASNSMILLTLPSSHPKLDLTPDGVGSRGNTPFGTWRWDGSDWRELPTPTAPLFAIGAVFHTSPQLVPLPHDNGLLLYSWSVYRGTCPPPGRCGGPPDPTGTLDSQTFAWDGTRWTEQHPRRAPIDGLLVATPGTDRAPTAFTTDAVWRWTGSDWDATPDATRGRPPYPDGSAVYDEHDHDVVAYAGRFGSDGSFSDTWTWDGRDWILHEGASTTSTSTTTSATRSTTTTTAPVPVGACAPARLGLSLDKDLGSVMQQPGAFFALTNATSAPCTLDGYPVVHLFDTAGRQSRCSSRTKART